MESWASNDLLVGKFHLTVSIFLSLLGCKESILVILHWKVHPGYVSIMRTDYLNILYKNLSIWLSKHTNKTLILFLLYINFQIWYFFFTSFSLFHSNNCEILFSCALRYFNFPWQHEFWCSSAHQSTIQFSTTYFLGWWVTCIQFLMRQKQRMVPI